MATEQFSQETLRRFVAGKLNPNETDAVIRHLPEDDEALDFVDDLWKEQNDWHTGDAPVTPLTPQTAQLVEKKVVTRIHRSDLSGHILRMGTLGFGKVIMALIRPLSGIKQQNEQ